MTPGLSVSDICKEDVVLILMILDSLLTVRSYIFGGAGGGCIHKHFGE